MSVALEIADFSDKRQGYAQLATSLQSLLAGEPDAIANAANMAALLYHALPELNWVGFYFARAGELVLGPFQGKPACVRIAFGRGVCGTAVSRQTSVLVADVGRFAGHIACDPDSRAELVVPLLVDGRVLGVLDLDSPRVSRFDEDDRRGVERLVEIYLQSSTLT